MSYLSKPRSSFTPNYTQNSSQIEKKEIRLEKVSQKTLRFYASPRIDTNLENAKLSAISPERKTVSKSREIVNPNGAKKSATKSQKLGKSIPSPSPIRTNFDQYKKYEITFNSARNNEAHDQVTIIVEPLTIFREVGIPQEK